MNLVHPRCFYTISVKAIIHYVTNIINSISDHTIKMADRYLKKFGRNVEGLNDKVIMLTSV